MEEATMELSEYQKRAFKTALPRIKDSMLYMAYGLGSEVGEVLGKLKKVERGDKITTDMIAAEIGDVLWYVAGLCTVLKLDFNEIAEENLYKLKKRQTEGKIQGDGDSR
jgi:NTP pyrophosphatase (non-canonical NTP hydrolase)